MKKSFLAILLSTLCGLGIAASAVAQNPNQQEPPSPEEMAADEADRLGELLDLEDWQIFYVDSTLQHDFAGLKKDIEDLMKSRVESSQLYQRTQDRWMDQVDKTYKKIFNEAQWNKYLKTGAGKMMKARAKRKAKWEKDEAEQKGEIEVPQKGSKKKGSKKK